MKLWPNYILNKHLDHICIGLVDLTKKIMTVKGSHNLNIFAGHSVKICYIFGCLNFFGQNKIHSDLMSWQLVRVRVKFFLNGSEIPNIFRTGSEKPRKLA
jgi:hypothetical protein